MEIFNMFDTWSECGKFILFREEQGFWNISKWHFPRCCEEVTQQLYAEWKGWA